MRASHFLFAPLVLVFAHMAGCGGDDSTGLLPGDDGGSGDDTSVDATGMADTANDTAPGSDAVADVGTGDDSATDSGSDGGDCSSMTPRATCVKCCGTEDAAGKKAYDAAILACACASNYCGPLDGGASDSGADSGIADAGSDASVLGTGACGATCTQKTAADATCTACLAEVLGTMKNPGVCYSQVTTACQASSDCLAYVTCTASCK
jgi:hypothetical protein